ncbi:glycosyltransferase [Arthrobacter sp. TMS1-12-1]
MTGLVVHEWIESAGGSENVVEAALKALPSPELYCLWNDDPTRFPHVEVTETWLSRTPLRRSKAIALPFLIPTWRRSRLAKQYEWMLVSSHSFAHHVTLGDQPDIPKFVYVHTPARYVWEPSVDHRGRNPLGPLIRPHLRRIDRRGAQQDKASHLVANSHYISERIGRCWGRESQVIYPPVEARAIASVEDWTIHLTDGEADALHDLPEQFILGASRLVPYKRLDAVINFGNAVDTPVVIAGAGPDAARLQALADESSVPVTFLGRVSNPLLYALYQRSLALVFPPVEDFGIMPVEAMAAGTPVIGLRAGGVAESVLHGTSGYLLEDFGDESAMVEAMEGALAVRPESCRKQAETFDVAVFQAAIRSWVVGGATL